jgi:nucleotide-binding universal stress UspA family protein
MKRILLGTDGSDGARKALSVAAELAARFNAELIVTHVVSRESVSEDEKRLLETEYPTEVARHANSPGASGVMADVVEPAPALAALLGDHLVSSAADEARQRGALRVRTSICRGDPAAELISSARDNDVDAVIVGSRGRGPLSDLLLGSVSTKLVHLAPCTVVIAR